MFILSQLSFNCVEFSTCETSLGDDPLAEISGSRKVFSGNVCANLNLKVIASAEMQEGQWGDGWEWRALERTSFLACLKTGFHYGPHTGMELAILLTQSSGCWNFDVCTTVPGSKSFHFYSSFTVYCTGVEIQSLTHARQTPHHCATALAPVLLVFVWGEGQHVVAHVWTTADYLGCWPLTSTLFWAWVSLVHHHLHQANYPEFQEFSCLHFPYSLFP